MKYLRTDAHFSEDRVYRYSLLRQLSEGDRRIMFVGLNPSTADERQDDPTIRRCVGFARQWEFNTLIMANVHAFRSTDPRGLLTVADPVGPENLRCIRYLAGRCERIVVAWGANALHPDAERIAEELVANPRSACLGLNKDGSPKHPLYLPKDAVLQRPTI